MAWRFHGRATVNPQSPRAWGICDRCGFLYNLAKLAWQYDWDGPRLQNQRILVCPTCNDKPFEHNRPIVTPPDPVPVMNPRPDTYAPLMPLWQQDTNFESIWDTNGQDIFATTSQAGQAFHTLDDTLWGPVANVAGTSQLAGTTGPQSPRQDYRLMAPDGGPVLLVPDE